MKKKVIIAMSGGVDSSVAACLLAQEGYEAIGVTLRLLPRGGEGFGCCGAPDDILLAKRSAEKAGIPHYVLDYSPEFEEKVINYFVNSYIMGETPNPCLACNRHIKFDKLKTFAESLGASHIATGHYAQIVSENNSGQEFFRLFEAVDSTKDQSYVLFNFDQHGLSSTLFPVGNAPKTHIRELAKKFDLPNADKKDSQEICFVPRKDYRSFVNTRLIEKGISAPTTQPGPIKNINGKTIGEHKGIAFYTVGQRNGLGLQTNERMYVTQLDAPSNTVVVGSEEESVSSGLIASDINWVSGTAPDNEFSAFIKIRYKHDPTPAQIRVTEKGFNVHFNIPQKAVTPGQAAVIYRWDDHHQAREVLGGGKIISAVSE